MPSATSELPLPGGWIALIDTADLPWIRWNRWRAAIRKNRIYVITGQGPFLHQLLLGRRYVDHINHDGLDNRRANLRPATQSQNLANARKWRRPTSSRYKGVSFDQRYRFPWRARVEQEGRNYFARFATEIEAARWYNEKARELFGPYAHVNAIGHL